MPELQPLLERTILQVPENARLVLTFPMTLEDDPNQLRCMTSPAFVKHLPMMNPNMSLADIATRRETQMASGNFKVFKMNNKETGEFVGSCGMYRMEKDNFAYDCGLAILEPFHRFGYATEALFLLLDHGFTDLGFNRTTFVTNAKNEGMRKWLENAAGAVQEGYFRESWFDAKVNAFDDSVQYAILKSEWEGGMRERLLAKRTRLPFKKLISKLNMEAFTKIRQIGPDCYNLRAPFKIAGLFDIGTHMTFIRLANGKFLVLSTLALDLKSIQEIEALTNKGALIDSVIATNPFHTCAFYEFYQLYPTAKFYGTPRHLRKIPKIPWVGIVSAVNILKKFEPDVFLTIPAGAEFDSPTPESYNHFSGVVAFHPASKTVICDDCFASTIEAPKQLYDWLTKILTEWDFENLCSAHGDVQMCGGKQALQSALDKFKPTLMKMAAARGAIFVVQHPAALESPKKSFLFDIETVFSLPAESRLLFASRFIRMFAYGLISVTLVLYLTELGLTTAHAGLFLSMSLFGDVLLSLLVTSNADFYGRKIMLLGGSVLMLLAGIAFGVYPLFDPLNFNSGLFFLLIVIGILGVISPSGNEVGPFTAVEQSIITSQIVDAADRTPVFAWYGLVGQLAAALGSLACGWTSTAVTNSGNSTLTSYRVVAAIYGGIAVLLLVNFAFLSKNVEAKPKPSQESIDGIKPVLKKRGILDGLKLKPESRGIVTKLSLLFTLDAFAGGLVQASFLSLYFSQKFGVSDAYLGLLLFGTNIFAAFSSLAANSVVKRVGLINTMVFTHLPSNILLLLVPLMPNLTWATIMLLARFSISQMDTAPRSAFVAGVVPAEERTAVIGITTIVRTVGLALGPLLAGYLADAGHFDDVFIISGGLKIAYDVLLYVSARQTDMEKK
ncbi:hypothetical protein HDU98_003544 [Podochytrium sp. JEL0797]|nr:hypothetical protein HDU98_003544 [Podochytrium sp. JEL0797]